MSLAKALAQLVDFFVKAVMAYAVTPEGQKELADVWEAISEKQEIAVKPEVRTQW